jgi:hypothetical protein
MREPTTLDWAEIGTALDTQGYANLGRLLEPAECRALAASYVEEPLFRSRVVMARHGFGLGEYKYFAYPLPEIVARLRETLYPPIARIANGWRERLGQDERYPATHGEFIRRCHAQGQTRPTPLLLRYGAGDYNCLHQDLYGDVVFPLQVVILLDQPEQDFSGGEFVLVENRPRMQSRAHVVPMAQGEAVLFAVRERPAKGTRGTYRTILRHGVSMIRSGERRTLGIIFHDAA